MICHYLEVHTTPVNSRLLVLDVLHPELGRRGAELEVSSVSKLTLVTPPRPEVPGAMTSIVTTRDKLN